MHKAASDTTTSILCVKLEAISSIVLCALKCGQNLILLNFINMQGEFTLYCLSVHGFV